MKALDPFEIIKNFDKLPDDAIVPRKVTALLLGMSERTVRRGLPIPQRQITERILGHRVGDIRAMARGLPAGTASR
jgi:hypothetical protein